MLEERYPGEYVLIVTADHGQCPLPDYVGGVRLDPIQLDQHIAGQLQRSPTWWRRSPRTRNTLDTRKLWDNGGATVDDVAASLRTTGVARTSVPTCPSTRSSRTCWTGRSSPPCSGERYLGTLASADLSGLGETSFTDADPDGIPDAP